MEARKSRDWMELYGMKLDLWMDDLDTSGYCGSVLVVRQDCGTGDTIQSWSPVSEDWRPDPIRSQMDP